MGRCLFRLERLTRHEPEKKPVPAGRGYVRPHPGPLPQERGNRGQSQSQPAIPAVGGSTAPEQGALNFKIQKSNFKESSNINRGFFFEPFFNGS